jgi:sec-independent protein translocase protein TatA
MLPGPGEIAIVIGIALLIFGPKRLPELGKALGEGIGSFKKAIDEPQPLPAKEEPKET